MNWTIILDAGPLGLATQRKGVPNADACRRWIFDCLDKGARIVVPAVADFEVRRELIRARKTAGLARLDAFNAAEPDRYLPLTDSDLKHAAHLWAQARQRGSPTADPREVDCDVLIAAQTLSLGVPETELVVATTNVGHLSQFLRAELWSDILR